MLICLVLNNSYIALSMKSVTFSIEQKSHLGGIQFVIRKKWDEEEEMNGNLKNW